MNRKAVTSQIFLIIILLIIAILIIASFYFGLDKIVKEYMEKRIAIKG